MGFIDRLFRKREPVALLHEPGLVVLRQRELAESMQRPSVANFGDVPAGPCADCGGELEEVLITTGGRRGDPELWRDVPVAVDGWFCTRCGVFRYPRKMSPDFITELSREGERHGNAGRYADAELCFARIVWDWPGYVSGHGNYAEATRDRLNAVRNDDALRDRLVRRMIEQYELAVEAHTAKPIPGESTIGVARACLTLAQHALGERAFDRARRFAERVAGLPDAPAEALAEAATLVRHVTTRRYLVEDANAVLHPRIGLTDRPARPPVNGSERDAFMKAIEGLEEHLALDPTNGGAAWLLGKALLLLDRRADAYAVWTAALAQASDNQGIGRDFSLELLQENRIDEAGAIARQVANQHPDDATLWCNLAVTEILSGRLAGAELALGRSLKLTPDDPIAHHVQARLRRYQAGAALPRTLAEMSRV